MGNKLLMKIMMSILLILSYAEATITIDDIDRLVKDIKQERIGLLDKEITASKDPFVYLGGRLSHFRSSNKSKKHHHKFILNAIVNNNVKLNGKWYKLNSKVYGYRVKKVKRNYVVLTKMDQQLKVFIKRSKNKKIKFSVK